jgi:hypothetical protein
MVATLSARSALLVSELTGFIAKRTMKTVGRENHHRCAQASGNRAHGAVNQKPISLIHRGCEAEKLQPLEGCFS